MKIGGFPPRRTPPSKPLPTVPAESIKRDEEDRLIITAPIVPVARPEPSVAAPPTPRAKPPIGTSMNPGLPPRPAGMPVRRTPLAPAKPVVTTASPPPSNKTFTPPKAPKPIAFRNGIALPLTVDDIPF
jgi:hypothetical protein